MPFFGQDILIEASATGSLSEPGYHASLENNRRYSQREGIDAVMTRHGLDALIAPTGDSAWLTDHINGDPPSGSSTTPAAVAGYPSITVPMGFLGHLPVGVSFFGQAWSEPTLLRIAFAYEQMTWNRRPPHFLATVA